MQHCTQKPRITDLDIASSLREIGSLDGRWSRKDYCIRYLLPVWIGTPLMGIALPIEVSQIGVAAYWTFCICLGVVVGTKRCHDRDRSGWFQLIALIPFIGAIWLLIELALLPGTRGSNRFGADPRITPTRLVVGEMDVSEWRTLRSTVIL